LPEFRLPSAADVEVLAAAPGLGPELEAKMTARVADATQALAFAMQNLPVAGEPGYPSPGQLAARLAYIFRARLDPVERLCLALAGMMALDPGTAEALAEATLYDARQGAPVPPFTTLREEAHDWATFASPSELRAYLAASWNRLSQAEREGFLRATSRKRKAAA